MSAKPENTFIAGVHKYLPPGRANPYWMKNNNDYTAGIWDVWYSGQARDLWIEYKFIVVPKRDSTLILPELSALQVKWGMDRALEGRNVAVIVGCKAGGVVFLNGAWEEPMTTAVFKPRIQSRAEIAEWIMDYTQVPT